MQQQNIRFKRLNSLSMSRYIKKRALRLSSLFYSFKNAYF